MLNYIWGIMILSGILVAAFTGNIDKVTTAVVDSSKEAVTTVITMLGIMSMWCGIMKIAEKSGLIKQMTRKMKPLLRLLFPDIPAGTQGNGLHIFQHNSKLSGAWLGVNACGHKGYGTVTAIEQGQKNSKQGNVYFYDNKYVLFTAAFCEPYSL